MKKQLLVRSEASLFGSRQAVSFVVSLLLLLSGTFQNMLAANSFVLTERAGGKLVCVREEGEAFCDVFPAGSFKAVARVKTALDLSTIHGDTRFSFYIGSLMIDASLSEDTKYVPGKRSATLVYGHFNDNERFIVDVKVVLHWSPKGFTATVSSKVNFDQEPILADEYEDVEGAFTDMQSFSLSFAGASWENQSIDVTGKTTDKIVSIGQGENREDFEIVTVSLKGKL